MIADAAMYTPIYSETARLGDEYTVVQAPSAGSSIAELVTYVSSSQLQQLRSRRNNWDGRDSLAPIGEAIDAAVGLIKSVNDIVRTSGFAPRSPHISSDEDGAVVLEWWSGNRAKKLTVYVRPDGAHYIKVWGPHIENEMEDGELEQDAVSDTWRWLLA